MRFVFEEGKSISLELRRQTCKPLPKKYQPPPQAFRFEVTSVSVVVAASGMQFGVIEAKSAFDNTGGIEVPLYQKQVFFNTQERTSIHHHHHLGDLKQTLPARLRCNAGGGQLDCKVRVNLTFSAEQTNKCDKKGCCYENQKFHYGVICAFRHACMCCSGLEPACSPLTRKIFPPSSYQPRMPP